MCDSGTSGDSDINRLLLTQHINTGMWVTVCNHNKQLCYWLMHLLCYSFVIILECNFTYKEKFVIILECSFTYEGKRFLSNSELCLGHWGRAVLSAGV